MDGGTSDPLTLSACTDEWTTFAFPRVVKLDPTNMPWAALVVARGMVTWRLGQSTGSDALAKYVLRLGTPSGPWKPLPPPFLAAGSALGGSRGRIRLAGNTLKENPLAPLLVNLSTSSTAAASVVPTAKGASVKIKLTTPAPAANAVLRVVSHCAGTVTFRDIDLITTV
jgi:hypothetical protein